MLVTQRRAKPDSRAFVFGLLLITLTGCHRGGGLEGPAVSKIDDSTVVINDMTHLRTAKIEQRSFPVSVELPGRISIPDKDIFTLAARVQGRLEAVHLTVGDKVTPGKVIATLWSPDLATAAEELEIARSQKNSELTGLTRQKLLNMGLDPSDAIRGRSSYPLRSPIGGVVLEKKLNAGAAVQPGDSIMTIGKLGAYQFQGEVTPEQAVKVHSGMKVDFEDQSEIKAHVEAVSPVADPTSRLIKIRATFDTPPPSTLPQETFLKGQIILSEVGALVAPAKAIILDAKGEYVFVRVSGDRNAFKKTKVSVNSRSKNLIALAPSQEILPGAEIVSEGALLLNDIVDPNP